VGEPRHVGRGPLRQPVTDRLSSRPALSTNIRTTSAPSSRASPSSTAGSKVLFSPGAPGPAAGRTRPSTSSAMGRRPMVRALIASARRAAVIGLVAKWFIPAARHITPRFIKADIAAAMQPLC
jgi:hypothetical protein